MNFISCIHLQNPALMEAFWYSPAFWPIFPSLNSLRMNWGITDHTFFHDLSRYGSPRELRRPWNSCEEKIDRDGFFGQFPNEVGGNYFRSENPVTKILWKTDQSDRTWTGHPLKLEQARMFSNLGVGAIRSGLPKNTSTTKDGIWIRYDELNRGKPPIRAALFSDFHRNPYGNQRLPSFFASSQGKLTGNIRFAFQSKLEKPQTEFRLRFKLVFNGQ